MARVLNADPLVRAGQRVGKYILGDPIARGGMAEVWAARVEGPRGFVKSLALKFILDSFAGDSDLERLFVNEARLAAQLQHANLVSVFDFDKISDASGQARYYIAMERIEGHDLRRVLQNLAKRGRRLPPEIALHVAGEVLKGLRYVHERREPDTQRSLGLVHRDVSPHNILIGMGGEVKLSDFGIAKAMTQSLGTKAGMIRGKLAYASPEQLRSEHFDHRTDQFALGVTLWEAVAGQRLFDGPSEMDIIGKVLRCQIPPLPADVGVAPATEAVIRHMLAADPDRRYASTGEAFSALLACPGYTPDGGALEALMQEVFTPQGLVMPPTLPLPAGAAAPAGLGSQEGTKPVAAGQGLPGTAPAALVAFPGNTTLAAEPPVWGPRPTGLGDGVPVPRPPEGEGPDSATFADRERSVTGSAYVSTAEGVPPSRRPRGGVRAAALVAASLASVTLVAVLERRPWRTQASGVPAAATRTWPGDRPGRAPATPAAVRRAAVRITDEPPQEAPPAVVPASRPAADPTDQSPDEPRRAVPSMDEAPGATDSEAVPPVRHERALAEPSPHEKHAHRATRVPKPSPAASEPAPLRAERQDSLAPPETKDEAPPTKPPPAPSPGVSTNGSWVLP